MTGAGLAPARSAAFVHVGLCVSDLERSRRFYMEAFGFTYDRELKLPSAQIDALLRIEPKGDIHAVYLMLGAFTLELMGFDPPGALGAADRVFNQTGLTHLAIAVEDPVASAALCETLGGTIVSDIGRAAVVRDPDGQLIELLQLASHDRIEADRAARAAARAATG